MNFKTMIAAAAGLPAVVFAPMCAVSGEGSPAAFDKGKVVIPERFRDHPLFNRPIMGMNFGFLEKRGWYMAHLDEADKMADIGVTLCILKAHYCVETSFSRKMFFDPVYSQGFDELEKMIERLHSRGIMVVLQPCITSLDSIAMYQIWFPETNYQIEGVTADYWSEWFGSYRDVLTAYADLAERCGVEGIIIGAELHRTQHKEDEWRKTVAHVRKRYSGPLSYETTTMGGFQEWMRCLDFISISCYQHGAEMPKGILTRDASYWKGDLAAVSKDEMVRNFAENWTERFVKIYEASGHMPILQSEVGMCSQHGRCRFPSQGHERHFAGVALDFKEQSDYMDAVFENYVMRLPFYMGFCWWKWDEAQNRWFLNRENPMKDGGFSIWGKPAAETYRRLSQFLRNGKGSGK